MGTRGNRKSLHLTEEQQRLVEDNVRLVYYYAEKFVSSCPLDRDEIQGIMMYGLCKSAASFNPEKSKFSTYATRCMRNELFMRLRQDKKWQKLSYLSDIATSTDRMDMGESSWEEFIDRPGDKTLEYEAEIKITVEQLKEWIYSQEEYMNRTTRKVVHWWIENPQKTQADLAIITNVSQAQVSRILGRVKEHIISTFFRGDRNWLYGEGEESELSNDFMDAPEGLFTHYPPPADTYTEDTEDDDLFPLSEVLNKKYSYSQVVFNFDDVS